MLRITILCLLVEGFLIANAQNLIHNSATKCSSVEGDERGCYECYMCDGDTFRNLEKKHKLRTHHIKLFDDECQPQTFCCFSQRDFSSRELDSECGKSEPAGYPRSIRENVRSVLQGQYPWRTWIFSTGSTKPLCAGVLISKAQRVLVTSATCVANYKTQNLGVGFTRSDGNIRVKKIYKYDEDTVTHDIVLLVLNENDELPPWTKAACLPIRRPLFATSCIAVSDQDLYLNTYVPNQIECFEGNQENNTKLCAVVAKGDYIPEVGGGLFCEHETVVNNVNYVVNAIHLHQNKTKSFYTNISYYVSWIYQVFASI